MTTPFPIASAPPLTVWLGSAMFTFPAGRDIIIGRGDTADIRIDTPEKQAISRVHAVLRAEGPHWVAIDRSRNGIYENHTRAATINITDDTTLHIGAPDGPHLTFRVSSQQIPAARTAPPPPAAPTPPAAPPPAAPPPRQSAPTRRSGGPAPQPGRAPAPPNPGPRPGAMRPGPPPVLNHPPTGRTSMPPPQPVPPMQPPATGYVQTPRPPAPSAPPAPAGPVPLLPPGLTSTDDDLDGFGRLTGAVKKVLPARTPAPPVGALTIGRSATNDIVVADNLASRVHALLVRLPAGAEIRDNGSSNGTFVNGARITTALLNPGDLVTIGNSDLTFTGTTLQPRPRTPQTGGLQAHRLGLTIDTHQLLTDVSFTARPGTLTAVIGPSGAGKSTLIKMLAGATSPTTGVVTFDGHNVHAEYASLRSRIGLVPQDDVVHRQLTVDRALSYAAQLRLPSDTSRKDRRAVVDRVLTELELTEHRAKRVDQLSGGQRKRVSVAMELLTGPSLLILDEPTSGLDPSLDRQVMSMLRRLADAGRVVIVVTHSLAYLDKCDQVLLLAPGGKTAYAGPPKAIDQAMGTTDWADIFKWVSSDPDAAHRAYLVRNPSSVNPAPPPPPPGPLGEPARASRTRQVFTLARRQVRLIFSDRGYFVFLAVLPFILGGLSLVVPGEVGLGKASPNNGAPNEPNQLLILLNIAAIFMGTALTIRDLVSERPIFRREQSVGLYASTYLAAKIGIYSIAAALQVAVLTAIVVAGKGGPTQGAVLLGNPIAELYAVLALTAIVSAIVGLALSAIARTNEWILPMLVVVIMLSIVFSGGMIPVTGRTGLDQVSWLLPARWGFAAASSTVDLLTVAPLMSVDDVLWHHEPRWWLLDVGMLLLIGVAATVLVRYQLRLPARGDGERSGMPRWAVALLALLLIAVMMAVLTVLTKDSGNRATNPMGAPSTPTQGPAPEQKPVAAGDLSKLLSSPDELSSILGTPSLAKAAPVAVDKPSSNTATPPNCVAPVDPGNQAVYSAGGEGYTGISGAILTDANDPHVSVQQFVASFPGMDQAAAMQDQQVTEWKNCQSTTVTLTVGTAPPVQVTLGPAQVTDGRLVLQLKEPDRSCQRVLATNSNVVIDVKACSPTSGTAAEQIAKKITDRIG